MHMLSQHIPSTKTAPPPVWQDETSAVRNLQILAGNGLTVDSQPQEWLGMCQDASVLTWGRRTAMRRQLKFVPLLQKRLAVHNY